MPPPDPPRSDEGRPTGPSVFGRIVVELRAHAPFTLIGTVIGAIVTVAFVYGGVPEGVSERLFEAFHPAHVLFSAIVTAAMYRLHHPRRILALVLIGYVGSVGIGTLSDCLIPFLGEGLIGLHDPHMHGEMHIGFIDLWWLVNPLAVLGIAIAYFRPSTKLPHLGHVFLSTAASMFHMLMGLQTGHGQASTWTLVMMPVFLFLAVWIPCCTSDIVFPLLFCRDHRDGRACPVHGH
ncbi:MAG: hypothetical protein WBF17_23030 [Phycisphaerae bacterium]